MGAIAIADKVYWVGVKDPELRIFDIIMETKEGTTYNAYLVHGEKVALIDTVKKQFADEYFANIEKITPIESIEYLIVNHTEPDHSGAIVELLKRNPHIQIICSGAALPFVKAVINTEANISAVKDDHVIDLGGKKLQFKIMPYMHWPDTMMEYLQEDKILFSCDGFAAHMAEHSLWGDELTGDLDFEFKYYFDAIMRPFTGYIRKNLPKLETLDIQMIATSHGPVLRKNVQSYLARYKEWCADKTEGREQVTIFWASNYGNTRILADAIALKVSEAGLFVKCIDLTVCPADEAREEIERSIAVLIGTPTFNGDAPKPVWDLVSLFSTVYSLGKKAAVFGSYGWGGEGPKMVAERLAGLKLKVWPEPFRARMIPSETELGEVGKFVEDVTGFIRGTVKVEEKKTLG